MQYTLSLCIQNTLSLYKVYTELVVYTAITAYTELVCKVYIHLLSEYSKN